MLEKSRIVAAPLPVRTLLARFIVANQRQSSLNEQRTLRSSVCIDTDNDANHISNQSVEQLEHDDRELDELDRERSAAASGRASRCHQISKNTLCLSDDERVASSEYKRGSHVHFSVASTLHLVGLHWRLADARHRRVGRLVLPRRRSVGRRWRRRSAAQRQRRAQANTITVNKRTQ